MCGRLVLYTLPPEASGYFDTTETAADLYGPR